MAATRRPSIEEVFFSELRDWSEIKLRIVVKYLAAYMKKRGSSHSIIYYIDGFAGPGHYGKNDETPKEGSPLRVARLAQSIADSGKSNRLECIFTERRQKHCEDLAAALGNFDPDIARLQCGPFRKHLHSILNRIGSSPSVFFLDPFGVKHITIADVESLVRRRDTEILLNLNAPRLRKLAGFEDSTSKDAKGKVALVSSVLGEDPANPRPEWLKEWNRLGKDGIGWESWAVDTYADQLLERGREIRYVVKYPVRESYGANPKYWLLFATRHIDAILIMNEFICTEEEILFAAPKSARGVAQLGFLDSVQEAQLAPRLVKLLEDIHDYGTDNQGCCRSDIVRHFVEARFGEFKQKHYRQALNSLVQSGRARFGNYGPGQKDRAPITFL